PETGWGMVFPKYINAEVRNHAVNGRSTKSFRTLGHWKKVEEELKAGDWVFIQFGHNDQKESDTSRYAAAQTDYRKNLVRYIKEIKAKGANPLLITPVMRRKFDANGVFVDQHGDYPTVMKEVGKEMKVSVLDLHAKSRKVIEQHGVENSKHMFLNLEKEVWANYAEGKEDNTHFTPYGASVVAGLVAEGIKELKLSLSDFLTLSPYPGKYTYELPHVLQVSFKKDTFNISTYNARADVITLNTRAIQQAIDACTQSGGGTVLVPNDLWLTGPLVLKSNVSLHVSHDAVLHFTNNPADYPLVQTNWEGLEAIRAQSPI